MSDQHCKVVISPGLSRRAALKKRTEDGERALVGSTTINGRPSSLGSRADTEWKRKRALLNDCRGRDYENIDAVREREGVMIAGWDQAPLSQ